MAPKGNGVYIATKDGVLVTIGETRADIERGVIDFVRQERSFGFRYSYEGDLEEAFELEFRPYQVHPKWLRQTPNMQ